MAWFTENPGQRFFSAAVSIAATLILAVLAWELMGSMVERYLRGDDHSGKRVERSARIRTLLPLARYAMQAVLVIVAGVVILSEIGVDTTPLLAGAGIIGLAIGFGSQELVKDVINGLFILMEDTIAVGDIVKVGEHAGVVESITIRTVRLRDLEGHVHTVPFGEVTNVVNLTKHYAHALIEVSVDYETDLRKVMQVMKDVAEEMYKDDSYHFMIYEPMEMLGVERYDPSSIAVRGRIRVRPLNQWTIKREYMLRLKEAFDRENLGMAYPVSLDRPFALWKETLERAATIESAARRAPLGQSANPLPGREDPIPSEN
jgi:small conductance mechanosensitive channel